LPISHLVIPTGITCELENRAVCLFASANLNCRYNLTQLLDNGQPKYISLKPVWQINGQNIDQGDPRFVIYPATKYLAQLEAPNITKSVEFACFLVLNNGFGGYGGRDYASRTVVPINHIDPPDVESRASDTTSVSMTLKHRPRCFANRPLSAEIYVNSDKRDDLTSFSIDGSRITIPGLIRNTEYNITVVVMDRESQNISSGPVDFMIQTILLNNTEVALIAVGCVIFTALVLAAVIITIICFKKKFNNSRKTKNEVTAVELFPETPATHPNPIQ
jgi:hypothetical protein